MSHTPVQFRLSDCSENLKTNLRTIYAIILKGHVDITQYIVQL